MKIDEKEFGEFIKELTKSLASRGVPTNVVSTAVAEAIKKREEVIAKSKKDKVKFVKMETPQMLYGPPPVMQRSEEVREVVMETPQALYGPPPAMQAEEVHQMVMETPQMLYGPPSMVNPTKNPGKK